MRTLTARAMIKKRSRWQMAERRRAVKELSEFPDKKPSQECSEL